MGINKTGRKIKTTAVCYNIGFFFFVSFYYINYFSVVRKHDAVKDVAVIGLPDARLGEIAAAIIEVKEGYTLTEDDVNDFCYDLPRYKRPRKVILADVPRNPTGKIEKPKLRKIYGGEGLVDSQNKS